MAPRLMANPASTCLSPCILAIVACLITTPSATTNALAGALSRRTCPYSCKSTPSVSPKPAEVFGQSSRCFETRHAENSATETFEIVNQCLLVGCDEWCNDKVGYEDEQGWECQHWLSYDCAAAVSRWGYTQDGMADLRSNCLASCHSCQYSIKLSDEASATCTGSEGWSEFGGWTGQVNCDYSGYVCGAGRAVSQSPAEKRRNDVIWPWISATMPNSAVKLMEKFDQGTFNPHPPGEGGLSGEYIVEHGDVNCQWVQSALKDLDTVEFANLGLTSFTGVGEALLLDAVDRECATFVEQATTVKAEAYAQTPEAPWGIDSLDGKIDNVYHRYYGGKGVRVYVFDTGIDPDHEQLRGRVGQGVDFTESPLGSGDKQGHGTHCAGSIAGQTVGVAPEAQVISVKVLGDDGFSTGRSTLQGVDFVLGQKKALGGPMVASGSLGGGRSETSNRAWKKMVDAGITVVVAAGNENQDADNASPASEPSLITVGAVDKNGKPASFSNFGTRLDIWGPGVQIVSAQAGGGLSTKSGTSMACPHVAGVAALLLEKNPEWSPAEVRAAMVGSCQQDAKSLKRSTGLIMRTWASPGPDGNTSSTCILAFKDTSSWLSENSSNIILIVVLILLLLLAGVFAFLLWKYPRLRSFCKNMLRICFFGCCRGCRCLKGLPGKLRPRAKPSPASQGAQAEVAPKKEAPKKEAPKKEAPKQAAPKQAAPKQDPPTIGKVAPPAGALPALPSLDGADWTAFCAAHAELAADIQKCDECLRDEVKMDNRLEDVWGSLRKNLRKATQEGFLSEVPGKPQVWYFVVEVAARRNFYSGQAKEVAGWLDKSPPWAKAASSDSVLVKRKRDFLK